jgi:hypothetical protein
MPAFETTGTIGPNADIDAAAKSGGSVVMG